jgi:type I restriction enzyme S subunit
MECGGTTPLISGATRRADQSADMSAQSKMVSWSVMDFDFENLPDEWQVKPIRDVTVRTSQRDPRKQPGKTFRYIDVSGVDNVLCKIRNVTELKGSEAPSRARKDIRVNDVLFATVRPTLKRVALIPHELDGEIASTGYCVLRANGEKVEPNFLYDCLITDWFIDAIGKLERGASYPAVRDSDVFNAKIPLPPLDEQRKIAGVLGVVQQAIEQQEQLLQRTTELKKTLLHQLFTHGLRGEPQKETEIGPVPESWEVVPLEQAGEVIYGIQAAVASSLKPIGTKILTNKNITLDGKIVLDLLNYFVLKTKRHRDSILKKGDLLFNWRSGSKEHVGKTAYFDLDGEFTHSSFILRIRPNDAITGRYLFYFLSYLRESGYFVKSQSFSVNAKFNKSAINRLPTYLPSEGERREIVTALDAINNNIISVDAKRRLFANLFRTLLHQLMTAQIRVNDLNLE